MGIDHGDGGAFPEIHVSQFPLDMGRPDKKSNALALTTDASGKVTNSALVNYGQREGKTVYSKYSDLVPKDYGEEELEKPTTEEIEDNTEKTRAALQALTNTAVGGKTPSHLSSSKQEPTFFRYQPSPSAGGMQQIANRMVKMVEAPKDPLEPPKFRVKRVPGGPPSPPVPVMHSPPRKLTMKDMQAWKVPPCISNWKNPKGYAISLDKRLAADGRGLQEVQINDNFAKLSESLYIAERQAREQVEIRVQATQKIALKQKEKREEELRKMAMQARAQKQQLASAKNETVESKEEREERRKRDELREQRRREWGHERLIAQHRASGRGRTDKELDRDITERVALGQAQPTMSGEAFYDQRLFNQDSGMRSGLDEEDSGAYSKPLLGGSERNKKQFRADREKLDEEHRRQSGKEMSVKQLEFERAKDDDPFDLDDILNDSKGGKRGRSSSPKKRRHRRSSSSSTRSSVSRDRKRRR
eukprot:Sspe_Gene.29258::Locus_13781_Transcript_1_1_Confidence_1.000_Length_1673::g.29258::m.29258/K06063/SNW1, SKIIP, SKIP; SNW domain-containing protein 1